ncbi:DUF3037 domain-containing protein [Lysinibacillus sphaericus]|uniref:DUF3037 domain-containing protein n=1 Tax=Lysinibacillus sphaericus TaxID=1421 RepID=UPI002161F9ED|nr:DUF3037 domain-containing protein [Lysinibacillus sphaericus]MCS1382765.1 DUF3037 domain-containing protein [Lysinibacillus sphaericus]
MENKIFFSVAKYVPDLLRDEQINFGFAYFYPEEQEIGFISSKNTNRILAFDDELDLDTLNLLRSSLEYDFSMDSFEFDDDEDTLKYLISQKNATILDQKTKNYINQVQFSPSLSIVVEVNLEQAIKDLSDIYLYYDRQKKERKMDKDRIRNLSKKIIQSNLSKDLYFECKKDKLSFFNKPYDFRVLIGSEYKYIKALTFDYKKHYRLYEELKIFMYDLEQSLNIDPDLNSNDFIVVINKTDFSTEMEKTAKDVLEEKVKLITIDKLVEDLNSHSIFQS